MSYQDYFKCPVCEYKETIFTSTGRECVSCGTQLKAFVEEVPLIWRHGRLSGYEVYKPQHGWTSATPDEMRQIYPHLFTGDDNETD